MASHEGGRVRPLAAGDGDAVRTLFESTAVLGAPLQLPRPDARAYAALCLDYYLRENPSACVVYEEGGAVVGYGLVALDHADFERWVRPRAVRWAIRALALMPAHASRSSTAAAARFHLLRLRDGLDSLRLAPDAPQPAHLHFNVERARRGGVAGFELAAHADRVVAAAGLPGYFGEVNVRVGRPGRARALERLGGRIVHRQPNHTLSWLMGEPVERLTVERPLASRARGARLPHAAPQPPMSR